MTTTETFGLSPDKCPRLIAKLRNMPPEQLAAILPTARTDQTHHSPKPYFEENHHDRHADNEPRELRTMLVRPEQPRPREIPPAVLDRHRIRPQVPRAVRPRVHRGGMRGRGRNMVGPVLVPSPRRRPARWNQRKPGPDRFRGINEGIRAQATQRERPEPRVFPRDSGLLELRGEDLNLRPLG